MNNLRTSALLVSAAILTACGTAGNRDITAPAPTARVMFFNAAPGAPGVNFYANGTKVTAINSSTGVESTLGTSYSAAVGGAVAAGGNYIGLAPGQYTLTGRLASDTTHPVVSTATATLNTGMAYSYYQSGPYNATSNTTDAFVIVDSLPATLNYSSAYVRFVNAIYNGAPGTLTITATDSTAKVTTIGAAGVAYKTASSFVPVAPNSYKLSVTGEGPNAIAGSSNVSFLPGHLYTITARGDITVTSTTATNRPVLDVTTNQ